MTAAACWEAANGKLPPEITRQLNATGEPHLVGCELLVAIPEWEVALPGGTTTSHTEVMAICRNDAGLCVIGVEAKVLEDFGPLLGEKRASASTGQKERLAYLHQLLGVARFEDQIRYQLLHRTASALLTASQFHANVAVMLVHAFDCPPDRRSDFAAFAEAMRGHSIAPGVFRVTRDNGPQLYLAWCNGECSHRRADLRNSHSEEKS